jgi:hypothetical protein
MTRSRACALAAAAVPAAAAHADVQALGAPGRAAQLTWAVHITIASSWFDPGEHPGMITPMMTYDGLHDTLVRPMPGNPLAGNPHAGNRMSPSLAESWSTNPTRVPTRT